MLVTCSLSAQELKSMSFFDDKLSLKIAGDFKLMDEEVLRFKYPSERRPTLVYTNERANTNVALNWLKQSATAAQIPDYVNYFSDYFKKAFPDAAWKSKGVTEINGCKVG